MPNRSLRILIADEDPFRLMQAEQLLNQLGYYRIAPVRSFEELMALTEYDGEPYDLLIANSELAEHVGVDLIKFCRKTIQIRNSLIYECKSFKPRAVPTMPYRPIYVAVSPITDGEAMQAFMDVIDPAGGEARADIVVKRKIH